MPTRKNPSTSHEADKLMTKELREKDHAEILRAMKELGGEAIYTDVSTFLGWQDKNKVSRRNLELIKLGKIYLTGRERKTPTNRKANIYSLVIDGEEPVVQNKEVVLPTDITAADYASKLIAGSKQGKLKQQSIFNEQ